MIFEKVIKNFTTSGLRVADVQRYLDGGGDINRKDTNLDWTLLHLAAEDRNCDVIRLLAVRGADVNATDRSGQTALHLAVDSDLDTSGRGGCRVTELPTAQTLIELGADESMRTAEGATPRDFAAGYGEELLYDSLRR